MVLIFLRLLNVSFCLRWPGKKYTIVCPPPTPKKTKEEAKETKAMKKKALSGLHDDPEEEGEERKGVLYYEYDLMFHYLLASLRHADGKDSVTKAGTKLFDIFAGLGQHR
jgi:hypothetical protein